MTQNTNSTKATGLGEQFLLSNHEKYRLEVEYDFDSERVFIQLNDKNSGSCTVLDGSDIFKQVHEYVSKANTAGKESKKLYSIDMNGQSFKGTAEDIARWYCQQKNIKLYIEPDGVSKDNALVLWAQFQDATTLTHIAYFENTPSDIENAYALFFSEYLSESDPEDDFKITACA